MEKEGERQCKLASVQASVQAAEESACIPEDPPDKKGRLPPSGRYAGNCSTCKGEGKGHEFVSAHVMGANFVDGMMEFHIRVSGVTRRKLTFSPH